jgi:hypothetical protein
MRPSTKSQSEFLRETEEIGTPRYFIGMVPTWIQTFLNKILQSDYPHQP